MAASTTNMVKSKAGKMYESSSPQGKMIVTAATTGKDADFDTKSSTKEDAPGTMLATLQAIYHETQESGDTLDDIEELLDDDDNPLDDARKNLKKSNKDKRKFKLTEGIKKAAGGVKAGFGKVKESLSGKVGLALLGGGLLLLNKYGDEIAGPDGWLTRFLKYMKEDFIPNMKELYETITGDGGLISGLKKDWDNAWAQMTGILKFFSEIGTTIKTYVKKFDTNDDGILSGDEAKVMWTEIWDSIKASLWALTKDSAIALVSAIGLISIGKAALVTLFKAGTGLTAITGGVASLGVLGTLALVGVVAAGLWLLTEKVSDAYKDAITDEAGNRENFKVKEFLARFFGGNDDEGGFFNSIITGMKSAVIGGAAGGALAGTAIFPGVGTAVGAAVGALIGGVIGVTGGALGKKKIKTWLDSFEIAYDNTIDSITSAFDKLVLQAKAIITPGGTTGAEVDALLNEKNNPEKDSQQDINNQRSALLGENREILEKIKKIDSSFELREGAEGTVGYNVAMRERNLLAEKYNSNSKILATLPAFKQTPVEAKLKKIEDDFENSFNVANAGFKTTQFLMSLPNSLMDISKQDLHTFAFKDSVFERDFKSEAERELAAAQAAGYALGGDIPGSDKGNLGDYRRMIEIQKAKFKDGSMPRVSSQMIANFNAKQLQREMKADNAKQNKFTTYTSQDRRTSTEINQANFVDSITARNDFWQEYYLHKAASAN